MIPETRVIYPVTPQRVIRVDAAFLDPQYPDWRLKLGLPPDEHPGIDINIEGTHGNEDEGYPVVAMSEGTVVHSGFHRVWGNIVLIEHPQLAKELGLSYLASMYAHLKFRVVIQGNRILAGEPVGSIGRGDPTRPFYAHLHFELRRSSLRPDEWPGANKAFIRKHYIDPERFLAKYYQPARRLVRDKIIILDHGHTSIYRNSVVNFDYPNKIYIRT